MYFVPGPELGPEQRKKTEGKRRRWRKENGGSGAGGKWGQRKRRKTEGKKEDVKYISSNFKEV